MKHVVGVALFVILAACSSGRRSGASSTEQPEAASRPVPVPDGLIVPGVLVGPVTPASTEALLREAFGEKAVTKDTPGDDLNEGEHVTTLFGDDPARMLTVVWDDKRGALLRYIGVCADSPSNDCVWHTDSGIRMELTLQELQRRNGRPFLISAWATDYSPGLIKSWEGGLLKRELDGVGISLCLPSHPRNEPPEELDQIATCPRPPAMQPCRA